MTPWTVAHQAPLSMGLPRQEYWSGFLYPSSGDHPDPGIELMSSTLQARFFTTEPPGKTTQRVCSFKLVVIKEGSCMLNLTI